MLVKELLESSKFFFGELFSLINGPAAAYYANLGTFGLKFGLEGANLTRFIATGAEHKTDEFVHFYQDAAFTAGKVKM